MANAHEVIETKTTDGLAVRITLEEWTETLIDRALLKHKNECPIGRDKAINILDMALLDKRITALELKLKITHCLTIPFYLGLVAWFMKTFTDIL